MTRSFLVAFVLTLLAGCAIADSTGTATSTTAAPPATIDGPTTAVTTPENEDAADSPCLSGDRLFAVDGVISAFGGAGGDATQISQVRWTPHPGCEQLVVDLLTTDGAPASAIDPVGVDYNAEGGIIRINLPESINRSAIADSLFDGELIERVYVVATAGGRIAIDIHIAPGRMLALRAYEVASPSRIVIDVREQTDATRVVGATTTAQVVLVSPLANWTETSLDVAGYAKGNEGTVLVRVYDDPEGDPLVERTVEYAGETNLWAEFETSLLGLPARPLDIEVVPQGAPVETAARVGVDATDRTVADPPEV
ncbi:MAG: hypothetical protein QNJ81_08395 [Acidimicrobiia bacterium]|nr:hypothetical protein [Acidimicrobiia bacterium]